MLEFFRTHQKLMMWITGLFIIPSMVGFGVYQYFSDSGSQGTLAEVGKVKITQNYFQQEWQRTPQSTKQETDTTANRMAFLSQLVSQQVVAQAIEKNHMVVPVKAVQDLMASDPQFQVNGQFNLQKYNEVLASYGYSPQAYQNYLIGQVLRAQFLRPVAGSGLQVPEAEKALLNVLSSVRTVRVLNIDSKRFEANIKPTDAQLQAYYQQHLDAFKVPQRLTVSYIYLDPQGYNPSEAEMSTYYQQHADQFHAVASRSVSFIQLSVPPKATEQDKAAIKAQAEKIVAQVKQDPVSFANLAKNYSDDQPTKANGGLLSADLNPSDLPADISKVVFALPEHGVSAVIPVANGYQIYYVNKINPVGTGLNAVRDQVKKALQSQHYQTAFQALKDEVYNANGVSDISEIASQVGLPELKASGIEQNGLAPAWVAGPDAAIKSPNAAILAMPKIHAELFRNPSVGQATGLIEVGEGRNIVLQVRAIQPAQTITFQDAKAEVARLYIHEQAMAQAKAAAEAAVAKAKAQPQAGGVPNLEGFSQPVEISVRQQVPLSVLKTILTHSTEPGFVIYPLDNAYGVAYIEGGSVDNTLLNQNQLYYLSNLHALTAQSVIQAYVRSLWSYYDASISEKARANLRN